MILTPYMERVVHRPMFTVIRLHRLELQLELQLLDSQYPFLRQDSQHLFKATDLG